MSLRDRFPEILADYRPDEEFDGIEATPFSDYVRTAMFESLSKFDPNVTLASFASIRLTGEHFADSLFDEAAAQIFINVQREIASVAPAGSEEDVRIGFQALGRGSVIIALAPMLPDAAGDDTLPGPVPAALETAIVKVLDVHDAFESDEAQRAASTASGELLGRLRQLVGTLDSFDAGIDIDLSRSNGSRRQSSITERGRRAAREWFQTQRSVEVRILSGVLAGVSLGSEFAKVELRLGRNKSEISEVPLAVAKSLPWDTMLRVKVRSINAPDGASGPRQRNEFISQIGHEDVLGDDEDAAGRSDES